VDSEKSPGSRFWLNASRAAEDEKAVREFLRGEGRGIDGAAFRAFVRRCRSRVGPGPVFEPARNMVLDGVRYDWGVWFRPRPGGDTTTEQVALEQTNGMALTEQPSLDMVTTRDEDDAGYEQNDDVAEVDRSLGTVAHLSKAHTVVTSSPAHASSPDRPSSSPSSVSPVSSSPASSPRRDDADAAASAQQTVFRR